MTLRVCIPTAGTGSRLGELTRFVNKSLVSIANRPTLSHLIEQFPPDTEFVIALGHQGHLVREYLGLAYPQRRFFFAEVTPFEGPGSGLGLSLLACREYLQQPFVFLSCDTLVKGSIPAPDDGNWMAYAEVDDLAPYRTVAVKAGQVEAICEKGVGQPGSHKPYIGLAGIRDHQAFWRAMAAGGDSAVQTGEAHGLRQLLALGMRALPFEWHDTGNPASLAQTRASYRQADAPNILEKANEAIWFVDGQVIKFSDDRKFIANRVARASELEGFIPALSGVQPHMYRYSRADGKVLSEVVNLPLFGKLLAHSKRFWAARPLQGAAAQGFQALCMKFYRDKTFERVALFYKNFNRQDGTQAINGRPMPTLDSLLHRVDWSALSQGVPVRFHGDFHFENILWDDRSQRFTFLDWRQDFGGELAHGDVYYDLAKLMHGLIVCHELIAQDLYCVQWQDDAIAYDFHRKQMLVACEQAFEAWLREQGFDAHRVRLITALIFLNIAALHHHPYSLLLYALGKDMLADALEPPNATD